MEYKNVWYETQCSDRDFYVQHFYTPVNIMGFGLGLFAGESIAETSLSNPSTFTLPPHKQLKKIQQKSLKCTQSMMMIFLFIMKLQQLTAS